MNWDDAYNNIISIPNAATFPPKWGADAAAFKDNHKHSKIDICYGTSEREMMDIFYPDAESNGLIIFVHGGYWHKFDKNSWSHLALGGLKRGYSVAIVSYPLAPDARLSEMTVAISHAIEKAANLVSGSIYLAGHSAGGHLVTRMICQNCNLNDHTRHRIMKVLSISGLHDLNPLMNTQMNNILRIDQEEAQKESPVFQDKISAIKTTCWVGGDEKPEFIRQSKLLAENWPETNVIIESGKHHFDVIDGLCQPDSDMMNSLLS